MKKTKEKFISEANKIHGDKYDYSLVEYVNNKTKIKIICPKHGVFEQKPKQHIIGQNCLKCINENQTKTISQFISEAELKHNNYYTYNDVIYINNKTKVKINCPEHGLFEQSPNRHLNGHGCNKCYIEKQKKTIEQFIIESKIINDDYIDYSLSEYINNETKIKLICKKHGPFEQTPNNHLSKKHKCLKCSTIESKEEKNIINFMSQYCVIDAKNRKILNGKELDIYIPSHNLAIEYDGLYWHSEIHKPSNYHLNKTQLCEKQGIQLIHIFEDEWLFKQDIVKSRLLNILGLTPNKIYARKTKIKEVSPKECKIFLDSNHLQGSVNSSIKLGLYLGDELVSLMTFGCLRKSMGSKSIENTYELYRFASKLNTSVIGGADKLLKYFIKTYKPKNIISYADRRWSKGDLYEKLGFNFTLNTPKSFNYIINNKREYRFKYRKDVLVKQGYDTTKTEHEIMLDRGIYRIYDCGAKKYELINPEP